MIAALRGALVAAVMLQVVGNCRGDEDLDPAELASRASELRTLEGARVGYEERQGEFILLLDSLVSSGSAEIPRDLLRSENPVARCLGLQAWCDLKMEESVPVLMDSLCDRELLVVRAQGCRISEMTVGQFARRLIHDANFLRASAGRRPLLCERELLALEMSILSRNDTASMHAAARSRLLRAYRDGVLESVQHAVKLTQPGMERIDVVRALGRLPWQLGGIQLLQEIGLDEERPRLVRFVAASGLSRNGGETALTALNAMRSWLDEQTSDLLGTRLIREVEERDRLGHLWRKGKASQYSPGDEGNRELVIASVDTAHPSAIPRLAKIAASSMVSDPQVKRALLSALTRIVGALHVHVHDWCTWADAPFLVEGLLATPYGCRSRPGWLTKEDANRLRALLQPHLR